MTTISSQAWLGVANAAAQTTNYLQQSFHPRYSSVHLMDMALSIPTVPDDVAQRVQKKIAHCFYENGSATRLLAPLLPQLAFLEGLALGHVVSQEGSIPDDRGSFIKRARPYIGSMNTQMMGEAIRWTEPNFLKGVHEARGSKEAPLPGLAGTRYPKPVRVDYCHDLSLLHGTDVYLAHAYELPGGSYKAFGGLLIGVFQLLSLTGNNPAELALAMKALTGIVASHGNMSKNFRIGLANAGFTNTQVLISEDVPEVKLIQNRQLGSDVQRFGKYYENADDEVRRRVSQNPEGFIHGHAYDHPAQAMGNGKIMLYIAQAMAGAAPDGFDVICPGGGGGFASGCALAAEYLGVDVRLFCAETTGADGIGRFIRGESEITGDTPPTDADGTNVVRTGETNKPVLKKHLTADQLCVLDRAQVRKGVAYAWNRLGLRLEGSGPMGIAALNYVGFPAANFGKKPIVILLSGQNIEPDLHEEIIGEYGERWQEGLRSSAA